MTGQRPDSSSGGGNGAGRCEGQAKVDHITVRATTGHSTEAMTEHYSHVELAEKKEAVAEVLELVGVG